MDERNVYVNWKCMCENNEDVIRVCMQVKELVDMMDRCIDRVLNKGVCSEIIECLYKLTFLLLSMLYIFILYFVCSIYTPQFILLKINYSNSDRLPGYYQYRECRGQGGRGGGQTYPFLLFLMPIPTNWLTQPLLLDFYPMYHLYPCPINLQPINSQSISIFSGIAEVKFWHR